MKKYFCEACGKEHDGSYGSGRFCCKRCRYIYIGRQTKTHVCNFKGKGRKPKKGGWKCSFCNKIFTTRREKEKHIKEVHPRTHDGAWNKGLTKETNAIVAKSRETWRKNLAKGLFKPSWLGKNHSQETKDKISKSRKKFLEEHPEMAPYKLNHKSKGESYPERYFKEWLKNENIPFQQEFHFHLYSFDFLVNEKIDFEIDGDQHFLDQRIVEHDKERNKKVEESGFKVYRVTWSKYKALSNEEKKEFLKNLKNEFLTCNKPKDVI